MDIDTVRETLAAFPHTRIVEADGDIYAVYDPEHDDDERAATRLGHRIWPAVQQEQRHPCEDRVGGHERRHARTRRRPSAGGLHL